MKVGIAGSAQSNDILITVKEANELSINLESIVDAFFHDQIMQVISDTLKELNIDKLSISCIDKGALDFTIKARLITAISRMEETDA